MSKIISFSLWGTDEKYLCGAVRNAELAQELYKDWICRFYVADDVPMEIRGQLANLDNVDLVDMPEGYDGWKGMFARFLPGCDPEVEVFISRDCDSRLTAREKAAVDEWIASDKTFHAMRDHPEHSVPVLGGMWGMKVGVVPYVVFEMHMNDWQKEDRLQTDQEWLLQRIWNRYIRDFMCHDDGFFTHYWGGQPFPTFRLASGEFVGATYDRNDVIDPRQVVELQKALLK